ncbi:MAG TPA: dihydroorotase [Candidatus Humimicrobiaceae bacterium]
MDDKGFLYNEKHLVFKNLVIKNARIICPGPIPEIQADIEIENGIIKSMGRDLPIGDIVQYNPIHGSEKIKTNNGRVLIDAKGMVVCPSFMDMHVHLREPGNEDEEDIESGISAALHGGITSICCMPNTKPPVDNQYLVKYILQASEKKGFKVYPVAAMTKKLEGAELTEFGLLKECGAAAFSDDGFCVQDAKLMYEIMRYAKQFDVLLILHEEDYNFSKSGIMHEGYFSAKLGLEGISSLSETVMVARDIMLAKKTKARIHFTHVSSMDCLELIRMAKEDGVSVTCDVTPHHLCFDEECLEHYGTNFKVNPPLRSKEDREALAEALNSGVIDAIASDHAPHIEYEKNTTLKEAAFGVTGMETLFAATYSELVINRKFSFQKYLSFLARAPYKVLGLKSPEIKSGNAAEFVILDLKKENIISRDFFFSKSSNSPFIGQKLTGEVMCTINNGKIGYLKI